MKSEPIVVFTVFCTGEQIFLGETKFISIFTVLLKGVDEVLTVKKDLMKEIPTLLLAKDYETLKWKNFTSEFFFKVLPRLFRVVENSILIL